MSKKRGSGCTKLSLRGKHRFDRLAARVQAWQSNSRMSGNPLAFHKPGSLKK